MIISMKQCWLFAMYIYMHVHIHAVFVLEGMNLSSFPLCHCHLVRLGSCSRLEEDTQLAMALSSSLTEQVESSLPHASTSPVARKRAGRVSR